ncbi:MAG: hypothetical protein M1817_001971 [Caeruleum heppii]|nr:MAG: hypothetical protein M1817_001971 [Caeruleum heppii]
MTNHRRSRTDISDLEETSPDEETHAPLRRRHTSASHERPWAHRYNRGHWLSTDATGERLESQAYEADGEEDDSIDLILDGTITLPETYAEESAALERRFSHQLIIQRTPEIEPTNVPDSRRFTTSEDLDGSFGRHSLESSPPSSVRMMDIRGTMFPSPRSRAHALPCSSPDRRPLPQPPGDRQQSGSFTQMETRSGRRRRYRPRSESYPFVESEADGSADYRATTSLAASPIAGRSLLDGPPPPSSPPERMTPAQEESQSPVEEEEEGFFAHFLRTHGTVSQHSSPSLPTPFASNIRSASFGESIRGYSPPLMRRPRRSSASSPEDPLVDSVHGSASRYPRIAQRRRLSHRIRSPIASSSPSQLPSNNALTSDNSVASPEHYTPIPSPLPPHTPHRSIRIYDDRLPASIQPQTPSRRHTRPFDPAFTAPASLGRQTSRQLSGYATSTQSRMTRRHRRRGGGRSGSPVGSSTFWDWDAEFYADAEAEDQENVSEAVEAQRWERRARRAMRIRRGSDDAVAVGPVGGEGSFDGGAMLRRTPEREVSVSAVRGV